MTWAACSHFVFTIVSHIPMHVYNNDNILKISFDYGAHLLNTSTQSTKVYIWVNMFQTRKSTSGPGRNRVA